MIEKYRHKKTGGEYFIVESVILNKTNDLDGVLYASEDKGDDVLYYRDWKDFSEKFEPINQ